MPSRSPAVFRSLPASIQYAPALPKNVLRHRRPWQLFAGCQGQWRFAIERQPGRASSGRAFGRAADRSIEAALSRHAGRQAVSRGCSRDRAALRRFGTRGEVATRGNGRPVDRRLDLFGRTCAHERTVCASSWQRTRRPTCGSSICIRIVFTKLSIRDRPTWAW